VNDQLVGQGFETFLPMLETWSRRRGIRHRISVPMFPGYLFIRCALDKPTDVLIGKVRGLVGMLGARWDSRAVVADAEIEAVRTAVDARMPMLPYPYLREGQRVRIADGPLIGVEGILVRTNPVRGLLVLSIDMARRSVAVEIDCTYAVAA
jgi:transcription antitermination factor NusG